MANTKDSIAVSSQKGTKPLIVEYVSAALDGEGRLYARHSSAQRLPRLLRAILFGNTHKEVDISGAHYELIRLCAHWTTPRGSLSQLWYGLFCRPAERNYTK